MKYFRYLCTLETKNIEMALPIFEEFLYLFLLATSKRDMTISCLYSREANQYVQNLNKKTVLIDGQKLAHNMIEYNVGVSPNKCMN